MAFRPWANKGYLGKGWAEFSTVDVVGKHTGNLVA
jgi:hypothetical protein